jgi:hypothetical protein
MAIALVGGTMLALASSGQGKPRSHSIMTVSHAEDRSGGRLVIRAINKGGQIRAENLSSNHQLSNNCRMELLVKAESRVIFVDAMKAFKVSGNIVALITLGTR